MHQKRGFYNDIISIKLTLFTYFNLNFHDAALGYFPANINSYTQGNYTCKFKKISVWFFLHDFHFQKQKFKKKIVCLYFRVQQRMARDIFIG